MGRGGGQVVSVHAVFFDDMSWNPADIYSFYSVNYTNKPKRKHTS